MNEPGPMADVYAELRRLAAKKLAAEEPGQTLSATALVHEAWVRLAEASVEWKDKTHYLRTAATAMRRILVDRARAKLAVKRGEGLKRESLQDVPIDEPRFDVLSMDAALEKMAAIKPDHAKLVEMRFFAGLSGDEAASALGISPATADRMWRYARAWLEVELRG